MDLRVALVSLHTSPLDAPGHGDAGGMNVYLVGLADALARRGVDVELLTRATDGEQAAGRAPDRTPGGVPVRFLPAGPAAAVAKAELPALTAEFARSMRRLPRFDVVHSHYWLSGRAAAPVAAAWGAPHVLSLHTVAALKNQRLAPGDRAEPLERLEAERMLVRGSALTVAATEAERHAILADIGAGEDGERVVVIPPGVDTSLFRPAASGDRAPTRPTVLMLARIQPLKGVDLALAALSAIPAARRPLLVIAGGVSPGHDEYAQGLERQVAASGLLGDVLFLPAQPRSEAARLLREATLLIVPSHSETFGLVALEAAASGTPVVAARAGGLVESVADGVSGVLVDGRDPVVWAGVLDALLQDPDRLAVLSGTAREYGRRRGWAVAAADIVGHYERLLGRNGAAAAPAPSEETTP